jgi:hypothetical protein
MMLIHRFPLTPQFGAIDVVGKVKGVISGSPMFTGEGVKLNGDIANRINFTLPQIPQNITWSCWAKAGLTQTAKWSVFMSANATSNNGIGYFSNGTSYFTASWAASYQAMSSQDHTLLLNGLFNLLTITIDSSLVMRSYINGVKKYESTVSTLPTSPDFAFGCMGAFTGEQIGWNGFIADARIYNKALSDTAVKALFLQVMNPQKPIDRTSRLTTPSVSRL